MKPCYCDRFVALTIAAIVWRVGELIAPTTGSALAYDPASSNADATSHVVNSVGITLVRIEAGTFLMGAADGDSQADADERPQHRVTFAQPFWLGAHEVTQAQYEAVVGENPSWFAPHGGGAERIVGLDHARLPVDMVSWHDAQAFCRRLSALAEERAAGRRYRLPTEAEWEYACRAGTTTAFSFGNASSKIHAWLTSDDVTPRSTQPVGTLQPNAWDLFDMHGNVWEWCADSYRFDAYGSAEEKRTAGDEGTGHVVRGGDWRSTPQAARSSNRDFTRATRRDLGNGLRVVMERDKLAN
ncbi:MAG: formylglycine-generating enzyme family protein [Planctomycetaceae bacterium]|nr:formylglycine-generating enzyme family protein [Planctomycetaceae bacterium]